MPRENRKQQLTPTTRGRIYQGRLKGSKYEELAQEFSISTSTARDTFNRFKELDSPHDRQRSGRPTKVRTARMERRVLGDIDKNRFDNWKTVADHVGNISASSVQKIANDNNIHGCIPIAKPFVSECNKGKRVEWAYENEGRNWKLGCWTDEVMVTAGEHLGNVRVSRKPNEAGSPSLMLPKFASGRVSVMFWGAITYYGKSPLVVLTWPDIVIQKNGTPKKGGFTNKQYAEQILRKALPDFLEDQIQYAGHDFIVVEDGAPPHKGPFVREAKAAIPFTNLPHPASSPDLNPIEHMWAILKKRIWDIPGAHNSRQNIIAAATEAWNSISMEEVRKLIDSMDHRVEAIFASNGGPTKY